MSGNQENSGNPIPGGLSPTNKSDGNALPDQPRQPRNLQGLLRFAMEATKAEDSQGSAEAVAMNEERRKFLEEALANLTVDMTEIMRAAITTLSDAEQIGRIKLGDELPNNVQKAFDTLLEVVEDIDVANDLYKLGGFTIFPVCFGSENDSVRAHASKLLGDVCQNNPFCQEKALECGLISVVLSLVETEKGNALARAIYALSCACRDFAPACRVLVDGGGCETLAPLLAAEGAAGTKAAFLVRYLCHNYTDAREKFNELNVVKIIAASIRNGRTSTTEHLLSILLVLLEKRCYLVFSQCMARDVNLKKILEEHKAHPDLVEDTFLEEKEYVDELLLILKEAPQFLIDDEVDR